MFVAPVQLGSRRIDAHLASHPAFAGMARRTRWVTDEDSSSGFVATLTSSASTTSASAPTEACVADHTRWVHLVAAMLCGGFRANEKFEDRQRRLFRAATG